VNRPEQKETRLQSNPQCNVPYRNNQTNSALTKNVCSSFRRLTKEFIERNIITNIAEKCALITAGVMKLGYKVCF